MWQYAPILLLVLVTSSLCADESDLKGAYETISSAIEEIQKSQSESSMQLKLLTGQTMMMQLASEERIRSEGSSGIKQNRVVETGTRPYFADSFTGRRIAAVHNHANHRGTVGMGEFVAVLNGLEFKTRHNDYRLKRPSTSSKTYKEVEDIPYPDVPAGLKWMSVEKQMTEMKEWFKAWRDSDRSKKDSKNNDYRKFFKPNLCYLEGFWTLPKNADGSDSVDEPFASDRHFIDASTWHDLLQKIRFSSYTGRKDAGENYAFLPTKIIDVINDTIPVYAQWFYRILCHPLKQDIPLNGFRVIDDINSRQRFHKSREDFAKSRAARFQLHHKLDQGGPLDWKETGHNAAFLDKLMEEIPGLDNYNATLEDDAFGFKAYKLGEMDSNAATLNAAYYHRYFKEFKKGAMGSGNRKRGFSDSSVFMAMTSQEQVAPSTLAMCSRNGRNCKYYKQRWTYAIPLEIIYTTPLQTWNPLDLAYHGNFREAPAAVVTGGSFKDGRIKMGTRNGRPGDKAFNGTNSNTYYLTPKAFFTGGEIRENDAADTAMNSVYVLDKNNDVQAVSSSGIRVLLPNIPDVGVLRQRWPIMPVHGEGSAVWKEMDALKDIIMNGQTNCKMLYEQQSCSASATGGRKK
ncbi:uncharacterized protein LOC135491146 [Lineus longissimus]|uniref:uncharacterized protein LOC135491146 n=1 Tax=Lineus longissimus TaxID=88925 RepID=UPI002B4F3DF7